jgi:hypothetical protein
MRLVTAGGDLTTKFRCQGRSDGALLEFYIRTQIACHVSSVEVSKGVGYVMGIVPLTAIARILSGIAVD